MVPSSGTPEHCDIPKIPHAIRGDASPAYLPGCFRVPLPSSIGASPLGSAHGTVPWSTPPRIDGIVAVRRGEGAGAVTIGAVAARVGVRRRQQAAGARVVPRNLRD